MISIYVPNCKIDINIDNTLIINYICNKITPYKLF